MHVETHELVSRHMGRPMPVRCYGASGLPLVYVPSSGGDETEFARYGLPDVCAPWIDAGRLRVFSIDGCGPRTMFDDGLTPPQRIRAYAAFERHMAHEVLPWLARLTSRDRCAVLGPSYGAFVAANLLFKYPERIDVACGLGGVYGLWHRLDGFHDDDVYFHTPLEYLPRLADERILDAIRRTRGLFLFAAEADEWLESSQRMQHALEAKALPHVMDVWGAPAEHHERTWRLQIVPFLRRTVA